MRLFAKFKQTKRSAVAAPSTPEELLRYLYNRFEEEGYAPFDLGASSFYVDHGGLSFLCYYNSEDPLFFLVRCSFSAESLAELEPEVLTLAMRIAQHDLVGRVFLTEEGTLSFSVEGFFVPGSPMDTQAFDLLEQAITLVDAFGRCIEIASEELEPAPAPKDKPSLAS